jgi:AraC-like DNA-binding protein
VVVDQGQDWLAAMADASPLAVIVERGLVAERGWKIMQRLREHPGTQDMPVLFCTLESQRDSGFVFELSYLTKPVGSADLARAMRGRGLLPRDGEELVVHTVLVVDDDPHAVDMHVRMLEAHLANCRILTARNGREALECIQQEHPDVVLLDLMMPVLDGFGVLERLQEDPLSRDTIVFVLTGQALTDEDMARLNRGVDAVLGKGLFTAQETLELIGRRFTDRRRLAFGTRRAIRRAMAYIHSRYAETISLSNIAACAGLSERHLNRSFRQEMGVTAINYLNRYRVRQSRMLLQASEMTITQVAGAVGFSDSNYFARVFRREVGVSPRAYQRGGQ